MARPLRLEFPGGVYHVVVRGNERAAVFRDDEDREQYLARLAHYRKKFGFRILAFCLMDNHVHLAIRTGQVPLSRIMAGLQSSYTQWFNRRHKRAGHLFQGRYRALLIQEDRYLFGLVRYIHENPVKARVVQRAKDHAWSSDRHYRRGSGPDWLDAEDVLAMLGKQRRAASKAYLELMARGAGPDYEDVKAIGQVVKGDEDFATARFEEAGEVEPRLRGLSEGRVAFEVARSESVGVEELRGSGRRRKLSEARAVAGYLGKRLAGISLARMARYFHRDESTLVREVNYLEQRLMADARARRRLAAIVKQLRAKPPRWK
jgi:REP element-mobilizing transposase RayT